MPVIPAARLKLSNPEEIQENVVIPTIQFGRGIISDKSVIYLEIGLEEIGNIVEDPTKATTDEEENFRDATIGKEFFRPTKVKAIFTSLGLAGCQMTIIADLPTKIPGTGGFRIGKKKIGKKGSANKRVPSKSKKK